MQRDSKLMDMLMGYASAHQHPFNVAVHLIGIPTIMLGVFIIFSWASWSVSGITINGAHVALLILLVFYLTLDVVFSIVFLVYALPVTWFATIIGEQPAATSGTVAAATFFGGYAAQFVGHAVEKSIPVVLKHPIQANLAAPFFVVVDVFGILGLRDELFQHVQTRVAELRQQKSD